LLDQVNDRPIGFGGWHRHRNRLDIQPLPHGGQRPPEISTGPIQLVDEAQRR